jgi:transposase
MTLLPSGVKIHVALGVTDMRKGLDGLAMLVQGTYWPVAAEATGSVMLTTAQLSMLIEGIDWRSPERRWRPAAAG